MAKFNATGIEGLQLDLKRFLALPDEAVEKILDAEGEVVVNAHKASISSLGLINTHKLHDSISAIKKIGRDGKRYVLVYPHGTHHQYNRRLVTKEFKRSKHGRTYTVGGDVKPAANQDVGFVHEYGAPKRHIPAQHWMRDANERSEAAAAAAGQRVLDEYLKQHNL